MGLFEKKVLIYKKKDRETWKKIKEILKKEKIRHIHAGHYFADVVSGNGIGGLVDPRDFGIGKRIDREIYYIEVPLSEKDKALCRIHNYGLVTIVDEEADKDIALRKETEKKLREEE